MTKFNRHMVAHLMQRLAEKTPLLQVVIGPRQVGKTTAIKEAIQGHGVYVTADSPTPMNPEIIESWWGQAESTPSKILAIDEVQKIRGWSEVIKKLWDEKKNLKVILSGSAALSIEKDLRESLAGRFELIRAEHWNWGEALQVFNMSLPEFVEYGCYPGAEVFRQDYERWASYIRDSIVEPAIGRDILQLHPVENPALLRQLFGFAVAHPAQVVSLQKLQGQIQIKGAIATIQNYLDLLSAGFLVTGIQKYSSNVFRLRKSSPKLITHDNGLLRAFERNSKLDQISFGRYLENAVGARFVEAGWQTFYWSERDLEVDYVVVGPKNEKWAIEVKSGKNVGSQFKALMTFVRKFPEFKPKVISVHPVDNLPAEIELLDAGEILKLHRS